MYFQQQKGDVKIINCRFENNIANQGGAIYFYESEKGALLKDCFFIMNKGVEDGGAIYTCQFTGRHFYLEIFKIFFLILRRLWFDSNKLFSFFC